jgi:putative transposase
VPVVTLFSQTVYAFVIIQLGSRLVDHVNATLHPTNAWVPPQLGEATPFGEHTHHLVCDTDTKYGSAFHDGARTWGLEVIHTPCEAPRASPLCERFVGSLRREGVDHVLVLGNRHLVRVLGEYPGDFNQARPHQALAQRTPEASRLNPASMPAAPRAAVQPSPPQLDRGPGRKLVAAPIWHDLHHSYTWVT